MMKYRILEEKFIHNDNEFIPQFRNDNNPETDKNGNMLWYSYYEGGVRKNYKTYDEALTHINKYNEKLSGPYEVIPHDLTF